MGANDIQIRIYNDDDRLGILSYGIFMVIPFEYGRGFVNLQGPWRESNIEAFGEFFLAFQGVFLNEMFNERQFHRTNGKDRRVRIWWMRENDRIVECGNETLMSPCWKGWYAAGGMFPGS